MYEGNTDKQLTADVLFCRYLLFYQHNVGSMDQEKMFPETDLTTAHLWETLGPDDRAVYSHIASQDDVVEARDLSPDLMGIDLKPLNKQKQGRSLCTVVCCFVLESFVSKSKVHKNTHEELSCL